MSLELKVPAVGESVTEAFIQSWLKAEGDHVEKDEPVAELETEKVSFELPAPASGTLTEIVAKKGETVKVGAVIARMTEGAGGAKSAKPAAAAEKGGVATAAKATPAKAAKSGDGETRVMPAARAALADKGLSAEQVAASGPGGRLLKEDVLKHTGGAKGAASTPGTAAPVSPMLAAGDRVDEAVPMSPMRKTIARRLVESQQSTASLTTYNEADMSAVMAMRKQYGEDFEKKYSVKLGFMSFFVKAVIDGLKLIPALNAAVSGDKIVYRNYYDIGIAVSSDRGLVVPVLRNAHRLSFAETEKAIGEYAARARGNSLQLADLEGGTFTITNGGIFGSLLSTPIINPPQSGVLGMHTIQPRPVAAGDQVVIRPMMYLALTYDHRIVDGREAVTFLKRVKQAIEDPSRMLVEV